MSFISYLQHLPHLPTPNIKHQTLAMKPLAPRRRPPSSCPPPWILRPSAQCCLPRRPWWRCTLHRCRWYRWEFVVAGKDRAETPENIIDYILDELHFVSEDGWARRMEFIVFGGRLFVTLMGGRGDFVAQAESRPNFIERSCRRCALTCWCEGKS